MENETHAELSPLADALIEGYYILCEPAEVVERAIQEFVEMSENGRDFTYDDEPVTAQQLLVALDEIITYFRSREMFPTKESFRPIIEAEV